MLIVFVVEPVDKWITPKSRQGWHARNPSPHGWRVHSLVGNKNLWRNPGLYIYFFGKTRNAYYEDLPPGNAVILPPLYYRV
jgi:hypothetical protein